MTDSHREQRLPAAVDSYPIDVSPCGVRGVGGNVREWCLDVFDAAPRDGATTSDGYVLPPEAALATDPRALRVARGGLWYGTARIVRIAGRYRHEVGARSPDLGFRGVFRPAPDAGL